MTPSKKTQKEAFQRRVGFKVDAKIPLFSIGGKVTEEGFDMISQTFEGMLGQGVQIVLMTPKDKKRKAFFEDLAKKYSAQVTLLDDNATEQKRLYNVSDVTFVFDNTGDAVKKAWKAKSVPLTHLSRVAIDYNPIEEAGNGFVYKEGDMWSFFTAFVRAHETYKFPYDWNTIIMNGVR
jgi:glycogen synthase